MATGYLIVHVYADNVAIPVESADVQITGEKTDLRLKTDISGKTPKVELYAPNKELSLNPQTSIRPYSIYTVKVEKPGLQTVVVHGVEVLADETSIQTIYMNTVGVEDSQEKHINLPEHELWEESAPKIKENAFKVTGEENIGLRVLPRVLIPEFVIVHDGIPTNTNAPNYHVLYTDYIKNVASSEIYSTWPRETIKANVYAIMSFTLNRVFTEWYRSRGYTFSITGSPAYDQKYTHGRTIFSTISDVVDEIFDKYLKFPNVKQPFFAQYNDGIKVNNKGWLSQWGSKDLGDKGYNALQIVRNYYGNSIYLETAEEIEGTPFSFPGYNLQLDSCGEPVQKIQNELNVISGSYPAIPKISPTDGKFGPKTKEAVQAFQKAFNLTADGVVGFVTWNKISQIFSAVSKMIQGAV